MDLQGVFVKIGDFIKFKGFLVEFLENKRSWKNQKPQENRQKLDFSEPRLYNAPSLHNVEIVLCFFFLQNKIVPKQLFLKSFFCNHFGHDGVLPRTCSVLRKWGAREGGRTLQKDVFQPSKHLLISTFYTALPSKNPSKNPVFTENLYKCLLRTLPRSTCL